MSWLLTCHRLYAADPRLRTTRGLAAALTVAGERPIAHTTVTRWERACTRMPAHVLRRFEQLMGLPTGQLSTMVTQLWGDGPHGKSVVRPELLDKCFGGDVVAATEWADLVGALGQGRHVLTSSGWYDLAYRLLSEMSVSIGWRYLSRLSSLRTLQAHSEGGRAVLAAVETFVGDPGCQVIIDPIALLADSTQDAAQRFLRKVTLSPRNESELCGALMAWAARPPADDWSCARLAAVTMSWLRDLTVSANVHEAAADLLMSLPASAWCARFRRPTVRHRLRHAAFDDGPLVGRLLRTLTHAQTGRHVEDAIGPRMLRQALFSTDADARVTSVNVLHASPFRDVVADAVAGLVAGPPTADVATTVALVDLLGGVGRERHRPVLETLLCHGATAAAASIALAHLPGSTGADTWRRAVAAHLQDRCHGETVGRAVLYASGMNGDRASLAQICANPASAPDTVRRTDWWLRLPATVMTSGRS